MASLPCWIKNLEGKLVEDTTKADVVRQIVTWATAGLGSKQIVRKLNDQKVPCITVGTRKNCRSWNPTFVQKLITGRAMLGSETYPAIVDAKTFASLEKAMKSRTRHKGNQGRNAPNLFTGILFDARTKQVMKRTGGRNGDYLASESSSLSWRYDRFEEGLLRFAFDEAVYDRQELKARIGQEIKSIWVLIEDYQPKTIHPSAERELNRLPFAPLKQPLFRVATVQIFGLAKSETLVLWRRGMTWGIAGYDGPRLNLRKWNGEPLYGSYDEFPTLPSVRHLYQPIQSSRQKKRQEYDDQHGRPPLFASVPNTADSSCRLLRPVSKFVSSLDTKPVSSWDTKPESSPTIRMKDSDHVKRRSLSKINLLVNDPTADDDF